MATQEHLVGIFVGGKSRRMAGIPKGLLQLPDGTTSVIQAVIATLARSELTHVVLVGKNAAYADLQLPVIEDSKIGSGPLSGLLGLAEAAVIRDAEFIYAIACDMPLIGVGLFHRLKSEYLEADALVPKRDYREPLCARYRARAIIPLIHQLFSQGRSGLQNLLDSLGPRCVELSMSPEEYTELSDWDSPADLPRGIRFDGKVLTVDEDA